MYIQSKPKRIDRLTRDRWNEAGHLDMETRALIAAKELLATWEPEPLPEEACARVRAVLNAAERDQNGFQLQNRPRRKSRQTK